MSNLKVTFSDPSAGWITVTIQPDINTLVFEASYIYNSFFPLTDALRLLLSTPGEANVRWLAEPVEYEMRFNKVGEAVSLEVSLFPDQRRDGTRGESLLALSGSYDEICLPFWRALRSLQGRFSTAELEERWHNFFPSEYINRLTTALGK